MGLAAARLEQAHRCFVRMQDAVLEHTALQGIDQRL